MRQRRSNRRSRRRAITTQADAASTVRSRAGSPTARPRRDDSIADAYLVVPVNIEGGCPQVVSPPLSGTRCGPEAYRPWLRRVPAPSLHARPGYIEPPERETSTYPGGMRTLANPPTTLPQANDPCWCGSGRKYKRCHKRSEGRVLPGVVSPMRAVPAHIGRPPYAETGIPVAWDEPRVEVARGDRPHAPRRRRRRRDPPPGRRDGAPGHHHRRDRRVRPPAAHRARRLPVAAQLQRLPEERLHVGQRGHLPRHPRLPRAAGRRHPQPRRHVVRRRRARRHQRHVLRRRRRPGQPPARAR